MSRLAIASALLVGSTQMAGAVDYTVPPNLTATRTITGSDTLTVQAGGTITAATAVQWQLGTGPGVTVTNSGTINGTTRAFDTSGAAAGARNLTLVNTASGIVTSANDALRINSAVTSGAFLVDNAGLITSTTNGRAADLRFVTGGTTTIVNRSGGVIRSVNQDGIGLGGGTISVTNSGVIEAGTGGGVFRAINLSSAAALVSMTVTNNAGSTISSTDDAVRIGSAAPSGATILVTNAGTILSQSGQAIDFDSAGATGVTITINNLAGGLIQSNGQDGVRPGQNGTVNNSGTIFAGGAAGNSYDGVDFQNNTAGTVNNLAGGTISGLRHGINASAGTMVVTNALGASITGRNGSGVGFDGAGTVTNYGTITGAYAGNGTGDGDGVDIDLAATIVNHGTIQGTGAGGVDSGNRFNNSEGISIGGGTIENYGTVSGATYAIVVNNDSNVDNSRSGVAATTITNYAGGTIIGQNGYAIRLENKTGTAADNDTIVNYGTIIGSGAIPDPNGIVLRGDGTPDPGSVGTLNGVTYAGTGAARFIRGDGAAIQTGEGNDTLTNYGTITGRNGRAISLEGGNDTLNLATGSSVSGRIDGGVGTDTINLFGTGSGTLANVVNFEILNVRGGAWSLLDDQTYSAGATISRGATLTVGNGATSGTLAANVANEGIIAFNRTDTATFAGIVSGGGGLQQAGSGTTILTGANTYTGGTVISAGTLQIGAGGTSGSITGNVVTSGTLAFNRSDAIPFAGTVSGTGGLAQLGSGTTVLTGENTYTGGTTIASGTLQIGAGGATGSIVGPIANGGTIAFNRAGTLALAGPISGTGALVQAGPGTTVLSGANTYTGGTTIAAGTLQLGTGGATGSITGGIANNGVLAINRSDAFTLTNSVSGTGALAQIGSGTTTIATANTYSGGTRVTDGTLQIQGAGNLGSTAGALTVGGGILDLGGTSQSQASLSQAGGLIRNGQLTVGSFTLTGGTLATPLASTTSFDLQSGTVSAPLGGSGALTKSSGGTVALTGLNTYTGGTVISGGTLSVASDGNLGAASGPVTLNGGTLATTASFTTARPMTLGTTQLSVTAGSATQAGEISELNGSRPLEKIGAGTLVLAAASSFSGATMVSAGRLDVNGSLAASAISVSSGATLGGSGVVGALAVAPGGIMAPGSAPAIGTLSVAGSATFASGSTFQVRTDAAGAADRLAVGGAATLSGATVQVLAQAGAYRPQTSYLILSAAGGVVGRFGAVFTNLPFLTPVLAYGQNGVALTLNRNDVNFAAVAGTRNEVAAATGLTSLGVANPLYLALLSRSAPEARTAFNAVSGEAHASLVTAQFETAHMVREAVLGRLRGSFSTGGGLPGFAAGATLPADYAADLPGRRRAPTAVPVGTIDPQVFALWGQGFGSFGSTSGNGNAGTLTRNTGGFVIGGDATIDGTYRFGLAGGFTETAVDIRSRLSTAEVASGFGSVYGGASFGGFNLRIGGIFAGNAVDSRRAVAFPGFSEALRARYGGTSLQGFGEVGYAVQVGPATLEPFLGGAGLVVSRDGFTERGGPAALAATGRSYTIETLTAGIRGEMAFAPGSPYSLRGLVAYRGAFGDVSPIALLAFAGGSQGFGVSGVPIDRAAFVAEAGIDWKIAPGIAVGIAYAGQVGERAQDHGLRGNLLWRF